MSAAISLFPQVTIVNQASATYNSSGNSVNLDVTGFHYILGGFTTGNISGGAGSVTMSLETLSPDGNWIGLNTVNITSNGIFVLKVGPGMASGGGVESIFSDTIRIHWIFGSGVTSADFSYWLIGQS